VGAIAEREIKSAARGTNPDQPEFIGIAVGAVVFGLDTIGQPGTIDERPVDLARQP
jgi:hypothetical protein